MTEGEGQTLTTWLTGAETDLIESVWSDARDLTAPAVAMYLGAAREACEAYAPPQPTTGVPDSWRIAQAMQARSIYNAAFASSGSDFDGGGYTPAVHPLDWQVRQLLRPKLGHGAIL